MVVNHWLRPITIDEFCKINILVDQPEGKDYAAAGGL